MTSDRPADREAWDTETAAMLADYRKLTDELGVNTPEYMAMCLRERAELRRGTPWEDETDDL